MSLGRKENRFSQPRPPRPEHGGRHVQRGLGHRDPPAPSPAPHDVRAGVLLLIRRNIDVFKCCKAIFKCVQMYPTTNKVVDDLWKSDIKIWNCLGFKITFPSWKNWISVGFRHTKGFQLFSATKSVVCKGDEWNILLEGFNVYPDILEGLKWSLQRILKIKHQMRSHSTVENFEYILWRKVGKGLFEFIIIRSDRFYPHF